MTSLIKTIGAKIKSGCCKQEQYNYGHLIAVARISWVCSEALPTKKFINRRVPGQRHGEERNPDVAQYIMAMLLPLLVLSMDLCGGLFNIKVEIIIRCVRGKEKLIPLRQHSPNSLPVNHDNATSGSDEPCHTANRRTTFRPLWRSGRN